MKFSPKRIRQRASRAVQGLDLWQPMLQEIADYMMPYRRGRFNQTPGPPNLNKIFDSTPLRGGPRFASRVQQFLMPPGEKFYALEAGPAMRSDKMKEKQLNEELEALGELGHAALAGSNMATASHEMFLDYFAGTGAMLMLEGPDHMPIRCVSVPKWEVALELGPWGDISGRHWVRKYKASHLEELWPNGTYSDSLRQKMRGEQDEDIEICQSCVWDEAALRWRLLVFRHGAAAGSETGSQDEPFIHTEEMRTSPWITPRQFVCPGEAEGFGAAMLALPGAKTLNKVREYDLMAAALALFGVWAYQDESAFNPETARLEPGAFWKVASNASSGAFGPSVARLNVPGDYDLSRMITEDERAQIELAMMDKQLPPVTGSVRSPTELMERLKDAGEEMVGLLARQQREIVEPVVLRTHEILYNKKIMQTPLSIDQLTIGLRVTSPIVKAAQAQAVKPYVDTAQIVAALGGPQALPMAMRLETAVPWIARQLGIREEHIPSQQEIEQMKQAQAEAAQAAMAAEAAKNAPPPPSEEQQIMSGAVQ